MYCHSGLFLDCFEMNEVNDYFTTNSGHFLAVCMFIFQKTEVQTVKVGSGFSIVQFRRPVYVLPFWASGSLAKSFYYVNYGPSIITSKTLSNNLSKENVFIVS